VDIFGALIVADRNVSFHGPENKVLNNLYDFHLFKSIYFEQNVRGIISKDISNFKD
jgi:hypothetical protein